MIKKWLIRTKNNHILGPVSKDKIKELISNGTIKGDDEICSGNGYWVYIREQELISKYILGDATQSFNPVQEAKPCEISTFNGTVDESIVEDLGDSTIDKDDHKTNDDITTFNLDISSIQLQEVEEPQVEEVISEEPLNVQEISKVAVESTTPPFEKKKIKTIQSDIKEKVKINQNQTEKKKSNLTSRIVYVLAFVFLVLAIVAFKYKKTILNKINEQSSISIINNSFAQETLPTKKKNG